jgi:membrane associated rhomboid family serine protease
MKSIPGTLTLAVVLLVVFGIEIATRTMGDGTALLRLGALPADGHLNGEYWRLITYAFPHLNWTHLILNLALLLWVGRIVERRVGTARAAIIYAVSILVSGIAILIKFSLAPGQGSAVGASGGIFGLLATALILVYRRDMVTFGQDRGLRIGLWACLGAGMAMSFLPSVSYVGHLGGLISGIILGYMITEKDDTTWLRLRQRSSD